VPVSKPIQSKVLVQQARIHVQATHLHGLDTTAEQAHYEA